jgi:hypothetical protein
MRIRWGLCAVLLLPAAPGGADELASDQVPVWVEYQAADEALAWATLAAAEAAWPRLFVALGHTTPWTLNPSGTPVQGMRFVLAATGMGAGGAMIEWQAAVDTTPACDCAARVVVDRATSPASPMLAEGVLHELVHAGQYAVECTEAPAVYEAFALASLFHELPASPVVAFCLAEFQRFPEYPLDYFTMQMPCNGLRPCFGYVLGTGLFPLFLIERFAGGDPAALPALFAAFGQAGETQVGPPHPRCLPANRPDWLEATDAWLRARGADLEAAFAEFACARARVGAHAGGQGLPRAADIPEPRVARAHPMFPAAGTLALHELGSAYVELAAPVPSGLRVTLEADPAATWSASVLLWRAGQAVERQALVFSDARAELELSTTQDATRLLLVVAQFHDGWHAPDDMDSGQLREIAYRVESLGEAHGEESGEADGSMESDGSDGSDGEGTHGSCGCGQGRVGPTTGLWFALAWGLCSRRARRTLRTAATRQGLRPRRGSPAPRWKVPACCIGLKVRPFLSAPSAH